MTQPALFVDTAAPAKPVDSPDDMCKCGHSRDHHAAGSGACLHGMSTRHFDNDTKKYVSGQCECPKFRTTKRAPKARVVSIDTPPNAIEWRRGPPELKTRRKVGGWYVKTESTLLVFIQNTKLVSENQVRRRASNHPNPMMARNIIAGYENERKAHQYRVIAAIEQAKCETRGEPKSASITRVGSPRLKDDDNLVGAFKHIRDAIAEALDFDDRIFKCTIGDAGGHVPLTLNQATAGKRKAYAVLINIAW